MHIYGCSPGPGTEDQIFKGMMKVILDEKLVDDKFINSRTENFTSFTDSLTEFSPAAVEKSTGVLKEDIIQAARIFCRSASCVDSGGNRGEHGGR